MTYPTEEGRWAYTLPVAMHVLEDPPMLEAMRRAALTAFGDTIRATGFVCEDLPDVRLLTPVLDPRTQEPLVVHYDDPATGEQAPIPPTAAWLVTGRLRRR